MRSGHKILFCAYVLSLAFVLASCSTTTHTTAPGDSPITLDTPGSHNFARYGTYHSVAPGETLWRIAKMYGVDVNTLKDTNNIRNVRDIDIGTKLYIPDAAARRHVITLYPSRKWQYIIIHHSATDFGSSEQFNEAHKKRGWQSVGYHFVIDNGTCGKADGQIETSPRWIKQMDGAHCKADSMNERGIGICLVGNFSDDKVSSRQMDSLIYLVNTLKTYYKIPDSRILGHGQVSGAQTECPGKRFPWSTFRAKLGR
jgi:N-acetylmuramoyl-L-alanine amidase